MNVKKMAKGITVIALLAIIAVGATLAYLSATTGTKTNKFTGSNGITGTTTETNFDSSKAESYQPGDSINKNPSVTINQGSENAYVGLAVDYYGDDVKYSTETVAGKEIYTVTEGTKMSQTKFAKYATVNNWAVPDSWELIAKSTNGSELYMYNTALVPTATDPASPTTELFQSVTVNAKLKTISASEVATTDVYTFTDINGNGKCDTDEEIATKVKTDSTSLTTITKSANYVDANGDTLAVNSLPTFVIDINGYAVQSANNNAPAAEIIKAANQGRTDNDLFSADLI